MTTAATDFPTYDAKPYRPDGGLTGTGVVMLVCALGFIGGVLGFVAHLVAQYFYLIILFPILIGLALGGIGAVMAKHGRVRNPWVGGLAGFAGGVFAMTAMHYFDYQTFQSNIAKYAAEDPENARHVEFVRSLPDIESAFDGRPISKEARQEFAELRVASFPQYMDAMALQGVQIKGRGGSASNLGYTGSYIYWGLEVLLVAGITFFMVRLQATQPYCRVHDEWKTETVLGGFNGEPQTVAAALNSGDLSRLAAAGPDPQGGSAVLSAFTSPSCTDQSTDVVYAVTGVTVDKKGNVQRKLLARSVWPGDSLDDVRDLFKPADTNPASPSAPTPA